ncbi:MAG: ABC transporter [Rhodospirillales bacterium]|nr:ABC transporter [Rhodospirillales bacterium]
MAGIIDRSLKILKAARGVAALRKAEGANDRARAQAALAELFADARGVTMKIGQLFSEMDGGSPFDTLAKGIEPYPLETMMPVLEGGLGRAASEVFEHIDDRGIAASLGQVHKAVLKNGDTVAVKIRYPEIAEAVAAEMKLTGLIPGMGPAKKWGIDLAGYKRALKDNMDQELDYRTEATRQMAFYEAVVLPGLCIPKIYPEFCSEAVLVQSWQEGAYLDAILDWPERDRERVGRLILSTFLHCLFVTGEMHGDPHLGNSLYRRTEGGDVEMALLDFGCTISITPAQRESLLELVLACRDGRTVPAFECLVDMGFDADKLGYIHHALPGSTQVLLKPFLSDSPFNANTWNMKAAFDDLLGEQRWWLRSAGPPESLLTVRAFHGVIAQLENLKCSLSWWSVLKDILGPTMISQAETRLAKRRNKLTDETAMSDTTDEDNRPAFARELRVHVTEGPRMVVSMTMPAGAAYDIVELMPGDVIAHIRKTNAVDLDEVVQRVRDTKASPQTLFELDRGERHYRVWLE